jgi:hypothetical protein
MSLKGAEREFLARPSQRARAVNVVDIAEWLEASPGERHSEPTGNRDMYWQRLLRQKLYRYRGDDLGPVDPALGALFRRLADQWRRETMASSSMTDIVLHPAYQRIIGLGRPVLPLIVEELQREPYHWFWALSAISGDDPAAEEESLDGATAKWLQWAAERNLIDAVRIA